MLLVALHLSGLAALCYTPSPLHFLSSILERPIHERPFMLIPVGYPAQDATVPELEKKSLDKVMTLR